MNIRRWITVTLLGVGSIGAATVVRGSDVPPAEQTMILDTLYAAPAERSRTRVLQRGETLGEILARAGLTGNRASGLLLELRDFMDPRRLRPNVRVKVRRWTEKDSVRAVELRLNPDTTLVAMRGMLDWNAHVRVTPVTVDTLYVTGVIRQRDSFWQSIVENDELAMDRDDRYDLAWGLARVYMFKLDFFHDIRPGDAYQLVYERAVRPDGSTRDARILVARIRNRGDVHPGVYFSANGDDDYYTPDGRSLRRAFRRYPVAIPRITSSFSWRRYHPILDVYRAHLGTDFGASHGTPVMATGDGTVVFAGRNGGYGRFIKIRHAGGYTTGYAHLSDFARSVSEGARVEQGEVIAYVGATGLATGPHLHYEFRRHGRPMNARTVDLPGGPPVPEALREEFERVVEERMALLDRIPMPGARIATANAGSVEETTAGR